MYCVSVIKEIGTCFRRAELAAAGGALLLFVFSLKLVSSLISAPLLPEITSRIVNDMFSVRSRIRSAAPNKKTVRRRILY